MSGYGTDYSFPRLEKERSHVRRASHSDRSTSPELSYVLTYLHHRKLTPDPAWKQSAGLALESD